MKAFMKVIRIMVVGIMSLSLIGCAGQDIEDKVELALLDQEINVEYGDVYEPELRELLNLEDLTEEEITKILEAITVEKSIELEKDSESNELSYMSIGEHTVILSYNDQTLTQTIKVSDTTAPSVEAKEVSIKTDVKSIKAEDYLTVTDLSKTTITLDDSAVKYGTAGTYEANVTVTDASGNKTETKLKVVITQKVTASTSTGSTSSGGTNSNTSSGSTNSNTSSGSTNSNTSSGSTNSNTSSGSNSSGSANNNTSSGSNQVEDQLSKLGNSGKIFATSDEAIAWADAQLPSRSGSEWSMKNGWTGYTAYSYKGGCTVEFYK